MSKIIDGKALALKHQQQIKIDKANSPRVVSIVDAEDKPSQIFTKLKKQKAKELGIIFEVKEINSLTKLDQITALIHNFNKDSKCNGIMVQLPLPASISEQDASSLLESIAPEKDIDGLNPVSNFMPATTRAVLSILEAEGIDTSKLVGVVGANGMVGRSLVKELGRRGFRVMEIDKETNFTIKDLPQADIVISSTGEKNLIKPVDIKDNVVLIDVGLGDFDPSCYDKASKYTPSQGGVGPMTIISLMENIVESASSYGN